MGADYTQGDVLSWELLVTFSSGHPGEASQAISCPPKVLWRGCLSHTNSNHWSIVVGMGWGFVLIAQMEGGGGGAFTALQYSVSWSA